jgi:tetratricopeptide (TPR) repeat protein
VTGAVPPDALAASARLAARDAGDRAQALGAFPAAGRLYEAALELWPRDDEQRPDLLLAYARTRADDRDLEGVLQEATDGLLRAGKVEAAAEAQARLAGSLIIRGERQPALECLERARELVEPRGPSPEKAYVLQELARLLMMADDFPRSVALAREALGLAETLGLQPVRARNLNTIGVSRVASGDREGIHDLERAVEVAAAAHSYEEATAIGNLAWMHVLLGDLKRAGELQAQSRAVARRIGLKAWIDWAKAERGFHSYWNGLWDEALAVIDDYLADLAGETGYMESGARYVRAAIFLARGAVEAATAEVGRAVEVARPAGDPQSINSAIAQQARVALAAGNRRLAEQIATELVEIWHRTGIRQPQELSVVPWVFRALGRDEELLYALEHEAVGDYPWHEAAAKVAAGRLVEAAEVYAQIGTVPDETYTRLKAAETLVAAGEQTAADEQLRLALPVAAVLGATAWTAEGESLLAVSA